MIENLTKEERKFARVAGVSANDVHISGRNSCGTVYGLYNCYFLTELTISGYTRAEIYRLLLRKLIKQTLEPW